MSDSQLLVSFVKPFTVSDRYSAESSQASTELSRQVHKRRAGPRDSTDIIRSLSPSLSWICCLFMKCGERERDYLFTTSFPNCRHNYSWARLKWTPGDARNAVRISRVDSRNPATRTVTHSLPGDALARSRDGT